MYSYISSQLQNREHVLWQGQPGRKLLTALDILLIPSSLVWCGFALFWEASTIATGSYIIAILSLPFVLFGLYLVYGRFVYKRYILEHTYYYVTNKRIIFLKRMRKESTSDLYYRRFHAIEKSIYMNGRGTLRFGHSSGINLLLENAGMEILMGRGMSCGTAPAFFDIEDAEKVYRLIQDQMFIAVENRN